MAFVKLDCGMLDSSLWPDRLAREMFITALLMAEPFELRDYMDEMCVDSLEFTGDQIPPGWYGFVRAAGVGIVTRAGLDRGEGMEALKRLCECDPESRTPDFCGKRMARISGGYLVLNYDKYRLKDHTAAERSRRYRERKATAETVSTVTSRVMSRSVTQAEGEAQVEEEGKADNGKRKYILGGAKADDSPKTLNLNDTSGPPKPHVAVPPLGSKSKKAVYTIPDDLRAIKGFIETWSQFEASRKELRKPLTTAARERIWKNLRRQPHNAIAALELTLTNGWQGVSVDWLKTELYPTPPASENSEPEPIPTQAFVEAWIKHEGYPMEANPEDKPWEEAWKEICRTPHLKREILQALNTPKP